MGSTRLRRVSSLGQRGPVSGRPSLAWIKWTPKSFASRSRHGPIDHTYWAWQRCSRVGSSDCWDRLRDRRYGSDVASDHDVHTTVLSEAACRNVSVRRKQSTPPGRTDRMFRTCPGRGGGREDDPCRGRVQDPVGRHRPWNGDGTRSRPIGVKSSVVVLALLLAACSSGRGRHAAVTTRLERGTCC